MGRHDETLKELVSCIQEKVRSAQLPKETALNPSRVGTLCGKDSRTVEGHWEDLMGQEVEGPNFRGHLMPLRESAGPWGEVDPPSDQIEGTQNLKSGRMDWETVGAIAAGVGATVLALGISALLSSHSKKFIFTCTGCAAKIDLASWNDTLFSCPNCGASYSIQTIDN